MRHPILLIALDGVGLGAPDPVRNPLHAASLPTLQTLLEGRKLDSCLEPFAGKLASAYPVDATLGIAGNPESATGQSTLLTGINIAQRTGRHFGPKPNRPIMALLRRHTLLKKIVSQGRSATLWNAYPPLYFESIQSGRRICSAIPMAFFFAGIPLRTTADWNAGIAVSADFTGEGWRTNLGYHDGPPVLSPREAGRHLARLALTMDFSVMDHWLTDYAGHRGDFSEAVRLLELMDGVLCGLMEEGAGQALTIIITSDHGNMEDMSVRGHTRNCVPGIVVGPPDVRAVFFRQAHDLTGFASAILEVVGESNSCGEEG
jgi:2,3-bisphosphoglycerate-independent phosphoglycerate mutase